MSKGLSDTQKTILKVISEKPEGNERIDYMLAELKGVLYPDLYKGNRYYNVRYYGGCMKEKNVARVTISKSINRLITRGLLIKESRKRLSGYNDGSYYHFTVVAITSKGKLMANDLLHGDIINQYEDAIIIKDNG